MAKCKISFDERKKLIYLHQILNNPARQFLTLSENPLKSCQDYYKELGQKYDFDGTKVRDVKENGEIIFDN